MSIYINLNDEEEKALEALAREERRTPQQQAAWMVVSGIESRKRMAEMAAMNRELMASPFAQQAARAIPVSAGTINGEEGD